MRCYERPFRLPPNEGELFRMLSVGASLSPEDPIVQRFVAEWQADKLSPEHRLHAGFALGKALGREGFPYLKEANDVQRRMYPWDFQARVNETSGFFEGACGALA